MSVLIPNTFQHQNFYVDRLAYFLTPEENVVLDKAIREIMGWHKRIETRKAPISLSVFVDGKFDKDTGERLCYGCGIGVQAVRKALDKLDEYQILIKIGEPVREGQQFWLQDDDRKIAWDKLETRRSERENAQKSRTRKATEVSLEKRGVTSDVTLGVTSDVTLGVTSDVNKETQEKPRETHVGASAKNGGSELDEAFPRETPIQQPTNGKSLVQRIKEGDPALLMSALGVTAKTQAGNGIVAIETAKWNIRDDRIKQSIAYFIETTGYPVPHTKTERGQWLAGVKEQLEEFTTDEIRQLYRQAWGEYTPQVLQGEIDITHPAALTKKMRAIRFRQQQAGEVKHQKFTLTVKATGERITL